MIRKTMRKTATELMLDKTPLIFKKSKSVNRELKIFFSNPLDCIFSGFACECLFPGDINKNRCAMKSIFTDDCPLRKYKVIEFVIEEEKP